APRSLLSFPTRRSPDLSDVIEVAVAVDHVLDRRLGDLLDLLDIGLGGWAAFADRIGRDHALRRDDEHRLMTAVAEDVDVVCAFRSEEHTSELQSLTNLV